MRTRRVASFIAGLSLACATAFGQIPSGAEIHKILVDRLGPENLGVGIVVGVIDANGRRVVSYGSLAKNDKRSLDGNTAFEIGSVTKVFTSLLLMDMTRRGEVALTDPVAEFLPAGVKVPERKKRQITLADLSTQSSGLPGMIPNLVVKDPDNPFAGYSIQQLYEFLSGYKLTRDIGSQYEYSNLGVGLLGHALSLRAGMSYEALVRSRICDPLGMADTRVTLTPEVNARLAVGHNAAVAVTSSWDFPATLAGAGALRSTANDMLMFLAANLGYTNTPLAQAMADEVSIRRPAGAPDMQIAYGWHVQTKDGSSIIWHNGGTGGYRSYLGYDPKARAGVVVLTNLSTDAGVDDIGRHLLNASYPLLNIPPPVEHKQITLDPKIFDRYVGMYQVAPGATMTMSRDGDRFYSQITGQPKLEVLAESDRKFFLKAVDAQLIFDTDSTGVATQLTLHQNGRDLVAKRLSEAEAGKAQDSDTAKRFKTQTQSPGSEAALREMIQGLQLGEPKYEIMSAEFAERTRQALPQLKSAVGGFGALKTLKFTGVGPGGADIFELKFEHATTEWRIQLNPDRKIRLITFRPL
jgi:D-alanyl-D-alanine-carboxypeptidase/D-alanyl-D-alanine-endopeptidase